MRKQQNCLLTDLRWEPSFVYILVIDQLFLRSFRKDLFVSVSIVTSVSSPVSLVVSIWTLSWSRRGGCSLPPRLLRLLSCSQSWGSSRRLSAPQTLVILLQPKQNAAGTVLSLSLLNNNENLSGKIFIRFEIKTEPT